MNLLLLKQVSILSAIFGVGLAVLALIPYINLFVVTILMVFLSAVILVFMKQKNKIGIFDLREGSVFGALIGFVSFIAFSIIYTPLDMLLGLLPFRTSILTLFFNSFGSFVVLVMLIIFIALLSALMNAFSGLCTSYIYEVISGFKKEENENIEFEIK